MTRALCSRTSKRKTVKSSQESVPEEYKENSPSILSQSSNKTSKPILNNKNTKSIKENISIREKPLNIQKLSVQSEKDLTSPVRKSVRRLKLPLVSENDSTKFPKERSVLCDKTNSQNIRHVKFSDQTNKPPIIVNQNKILQKLNSIPKSLNNHQDIRSFSKKNKYDNENYIPVYKMINSQETLTNNTCIVVPEKKETVYEFEIDENEEPVKKKKRKKRVYSRKAKIGPKALTINNIKYSSSESLVSLPEKPIAHRKRTNNIKSNLKSYSSAVNLNYSEENSCSVKSFMSHPCSLRLCEKENFKAQKELSVLHETLSEQLQSPIHNMEGNDNYHAFNSFHSKSNDRLSSCDVYVSQRDYTSNKDCAVDCRLKIHAFQNSTDNTLPHQISSCSMNTSTTSQDFRSSTPCKRSSLVVCTNSVFVDSFNLSQDLRPSTGSIKECSAAVNTSDNYFGFNQPEELEVPLVSPIKNINVKHDKMKVLPQEMKSPLPEKPSIKQIIEMLKATIPKAVPKEDSKVYMTPTRSATTFLDSDDDIKVTFKKPPRRSYERQRRIRNYSENEEDESDVENINEQVKEKMEKPSETRPKAVKKYTKKANSTKNAKPQKVSKAKQKIVREEEEVERLAAQMNAQFQEIEKLDLVVE